MSLEVKIPAVGESVTSGVISAWLKNDGDHVNRGDALLTLETDKVSTEITADTAGVLRIKALAGAEVKIGEVVALIEEGTAAPAETAPKATPAKAAPPLAAPAPAKPEPAPAPAPVVSITAAVAAANESLAVVSENVPPAQNGRVTRKRLSPLRRKIAAQLVMAQHTAAILTTFNEADMSAVMALRKAMGEDFQKQHGIKQIGRAHV